MMFNHNTPVAMPPLKTEQCMTDVTGGMVGCIAVMTPPSKKQNWLTFTRTTSCDWVALPVSLQACYVKKTEP